MQPETIFDYCSETGLLFYKPKPENHFHDSGRVKGAVRLKQWNNKYAGKPAGWLRPDGYIGVRVGLRDQLIHRVIWKIVYGYWPDCDIDHIDGDRQNNKLSNLRAVSRAKNMRNVRRRSDNTSGISGVYWHSQKSKWAVRIKTPDGIYKHHGLFNCKNDAINKRNELASAYGYSQRHGIDCA